MMHRNHHIQAAAGAGALTVLTLAATATADPMIGADIDAAVPVNDGKSAVGGGFAGRLGAQYDGPLITLSPELMGSYHRLGGDAALGAARGMAGLRLGLLELVQPGIFGHVGVGRLSAAEPYQAAFQQWAFGYDVGLTLELTALPVVDLGLHSAYNQLVSVQSDKENYDWVTLGAHVNLVF